MSEVPLTLGLQLIFSVVGIDTENPDDVKALVPCLLRIITLEVGFPSPIYAIYSGWRRSTGSSWRRRLLSRNSPRRIPNIGDTIVENHQRTLQPSRLRERCCSKQFSSCPRLTISQFWIGTYFLATPKWLVLNRSCSVFAQSMDDLVAIAHDVTSSRVLDLVVQSSTVPFKEKRKFVMHFIGHYHTLVDDRIGSRVGDNCWAFADPYLRVRSPLGSLS